MTFASDESISEPKPRILLLGARGQLGMELSQSLPRVGEVIAVSRESADFERPEMLRLLMRKYRPEIVVNAAAYTDVEKAEQEPDLAYAVNGIAPGVLAQEAESLNSGVVHFSTDYVFDGEKLGPYDETDVPNPLSVYGRTKLAGEDAIRNETTRHLILRTSWLSGIHGKNFVKTVLRLAEKNECLRIVADQHGAPTSARLVAEVTAVAVDSLSASNDGRWGTYHLVAKGETTWHGCAEFIVQRALELGIELKVAPDRVVPITSSEYPSKVRRPANSRLNSEKIEKAFAVRLPSWRVDIQRLLTQLVAQRGRSN